MINLNNYTIFDQSGSNLNLSTDYYIPFTFTTDSSIGVDARVYGITNMEGILDDVYVEYSGWGYNSASTNIFYNYLYNPTSSPTALTPAEASINFIDVSIFNPGSLNSLGIGDISIGDVSTVFVYPSFVQTGAIFMTPISTDLVQTYQFYIIENSSTGVIRPMDASEGQLVFKFEGGDSAIKLFSVDYTSQEVVWADEIVYDISTYEASTALIVNVGFKSPNEGVFERTLRMYYRYNDNDYLQAEIVTNAEATGQDQRLETLIENFGLPNPVNFPTLFKEADINEELPDWEIVNARSKLLLLEYQNIMPYIGAYKGLINAIKWLGYDDVYVKEWFKNIKTQQLQSYYVSYDALDRSKTLMVISPDERKNMKKLNSLSLAYCINKETGEIDEWGMPTTKNCYTFSLDEVLTKLVDLKNWLERYIIGVNCRITDITGEGIYFQRFINLIYNTTNEMFDIKLSNDLTAQTTTDNCELVNGDASMVCTIAELLDTSDYEDDISSLEDYVLYAWDVSRGAFVPSASDYLDPSVLLVGNPYYNPNLNISEIQWKASVSKEVGVLDTSLVSNPLLVYHNDLRFLDPHDTSSLFIDVSTKLTILLEKAYLRNAYIDDWTRSIEYSIYPDASAGVYWMESSTGELTKVYGYVTFLPRDNSAFLQYAYDTNYQAPLLSFGYFKYTDASQNVYTLPDKYFLDIVDGKIVQQADQQYTLNFNYDVSNAEQTIVQDIVYTSDRMPLFLIDPSAYNTYGADSSLAIPVDNTYYTMNVKDTGNYVVELYAWDGNNNLYYSVVSDYFRVWIQYPKINAYIDTSCNIYCSSTAIGYDDASSIINSNYIPIYDRIIPLKGVETLYYNTQSPVIKIPSISYFVDIPLGNSVSKFVNLTETAEYLGANTIGIDKDWQDFNDQDLINLVLYDKNSYSLIQESSAQIVGLSASTYTLDIDPTDYSSLSSSQEFYVQNITLRDIENLANNLTNNTVSLDVSSYTFYENQVVNILATDPSNNIYSGLHRVITSDISTHNHVLNGMIPPTLINIGCTFQIKYAYSKYAEYSMDVSTAVENRNNFFITYDDPYKGEYYLDSTWTNYNIPFDQEYVNYQFYDPSTDYSLIDSSFWGYNKPITVDISTLILLRSEYDTSTYLTEQRNVWTITRHNDKLIMKVWNEAVPFIYDREGVYSVTVESYDNRGNAIINSYDGLLNIINNE